MTVDITAEPRVRLGQRVQEVRQKAGLSINQLAVATRVPRAVAARWERGKHMLSLDVLLKIAGVCGVRLALLVEVLEPQWVLEQEWRAARLAAGRSA